MRRIFFALLLSIALSDSAAAQEWIEYQNNEDGFKVNFPGQPTIANVAWLSQQGFVLPSRVYSANKDGGSYSVTVVDYRVVERLGMERSRECPAGAETCQGQPVGLYLNIAGPSYAVQDIRGALIYGSRKVLQRDARLAEFQWEWLDVVEGYALTLINADHSVTKAYVTMHENLLYILEATVPKGYPDPSDFPQSLGFVDRTGKSVRYLAIYSNQFHGLRIYDPPPRHVLPASLVGGPVAGEKEK